MNGLI